MPAGIRSLHKTRVLLLPSESTFERDIVAALRSESCDVFPAADWRQALAITRAGDINVLVLDFGFHSQLVQRLSSKFSLAAGCFRTLVLADSLEQLTFASETHVDGVLIKPIEPNQVRTVVRNLLAGARIRTPIERSRLGNAAFSEALLARG